MLSSDHKTNNTIKIKGIPAEKVTPICFVYADGKI